MKKVLVFIMTLFFVSCENNSQRQFEKNSEGNFMVEEQINGSVIKRVVLDSNKVLSSVEYENTKKQTVVVYYYKNGKLYQSIKRKTNNTGLIENYVYSSNGKVVEKFIKTQDNEKIALFHYGKDGSLLKKDFFRTGRADINSMISYDSKGNPILTKHNSHFLYLSKQGNNLVLKPAELGSKQFISASVFVVNSFKDSEFNIGIIDGFKKNPEQYPSVLKHLDYQANSVIPINMNELDLKNGLKCEVFINDVVVNGSPNFIYYELYIKNLDSIPKNNLFPIVE